MARRRNAPRLAWTTREVAERLEVHPETVRRMVRRGQLKAFRVGNGRSIRIPAEEVDRLVRERET